MATTTVAAAGTALAVYYYTKRYNHSLCGTTDDDQEIETHVEAHRAPKSFFEDLYFFSEALRYTYAETFGRWRSMDLLVGLAYLCRQRKDGAEHPVADIARHGRVYGTDVPRATALDQLRKLERYFRYCSGLRERRPLHQRRYFVEKLGIQEADILIQELRSGVLKPSYILTRDRQLGAIILAIRGTHSLKDAFTSLTASSKPHHVFDSNGVVLGYSHFGMLAAARWLKSQVADKLVESLEANPGFRLHLVGHSMGGGTAAMLTMMLRETGGCFSDVTCTAIACPACMTLELAKSCGSYVTTVIHGADVIPTISPGSVDALRQQVASSSWGQDLRRDFINRGEIRFIRNSALGRAMENGWKVTTSATSWTASRLASCYNARGQDTVAWRGSMLPVQTASKKQQVTNNNHKRRKSHDNVVSPPESQRVASSWGGRLMQLFTLGENKKVHDKEIASAKDCGTTIGDDDANADSTANSKARASGKDYEEYDPWLLGEIRDEEGLLHAEADVRLREVEIAVNDAENEEIQNNIRAGTSVPSVIRPGNYGSVLREEYSTSRRTKQKRNNTDDDDSSSFQEVSPATWRRMMYPAGKIMHLVPARLLQNECSRGMRGVTDMRQGDDRGQQEEVEEVEEGIGKYLSELDAKDAEDATNAVDDNKLPMGEPFNEDQPMVLLDGIPQEAYGRIKLCRTVLSDHVIPNYLKSLETFVQWHYDL
jgi:hypothetical protein